MEENIIFKAGVKEKITKTKILKVETRKIVLKARVEGKQL